MLFRSGLPPGNCLEHSESAIDCIPDTWLSWLEMPIGERIVLLPSRVRCPVIVTVIVTMKEEAMEENPIGMREIEEIMIIIAVNEVQIRVTMIVVMIVTMIVVMIVTMIVEMIVTMIVEMREEAMIREIKIGPGVVIGDPMNGMDVRFDGVRIDENRRPIDSGSESNTIVVETTIGIGMEIGLVEAIIVAVDSLAIIITRPGIEYPGKMKRIAAANRTRTKRRRKKRKRSKGNCWPRVEEFNQFQALAKSKDGDDSLQDSTILSPAPHSIAIATAAQRIAFILSRCILEFILIILAVFCLIFQLGPLWFLILQQRFIDRDIALFSITRWFNVIVAFHKDIWTMLIGRFTPVFALQLIGFKEISQHLLVVASKNNDFLPGVWINKCLYHLP